MRSTPRRRAATANGRSSRSSDRGVDRVGTSFLRFLHVLCAEIAAGGVAGEAAICAGRDALPARPGPSPTTGWTWPSCWRPRGAIRRDRRGAGLGAAGRDAADARAAAGDRPAGGAGGRRRRRRCARFATRSRWSRSAHATTTPAWTRRRWSTCWRPSAATAPAAAVGARACSARRPRRPAAFWRGEAMRGAGRERRDLRRLGALALRIVAALEPLDRDLPALQSVRARAPRAAAPAARGARGAGDRPGRARGATRRARRWPAPSCSGLGVAHAFLAEALNAARDPGAVRGRQTRDRAQPARWSTAGASWATRSSRRASLKDAEAAFRRVIAMDATYGLGYAKLAQVLLEQGRIARGARGHRRGRRTGAAIRSSSRRFAATSTPRWSGTPTRPRPTTRRWPSSPTTTGRCIRRRSSTGSPDTRRARRSCSRRRSKHDRDGCHQTLVDFGDHLRRIGRIGDAVRLYRRRSRRCPATRLETDLARGRTRAAGRAELTACTCRMTNGWIIWISWSSKASTSFERPSATSSACACCGRSGRTRPCCCGWRARPSSATCRSRWSTSTPATSCPR